MCGAFLIQQLAVLEWQNSLLMENVNCLICLFSTHLDFNSNVKKTTRSENLMSDFVGNTINLIIMILVIILFVVYSCSTEFGGNFIINMITVNCSKEQHIAELEREDLWVVFRSEFEGNKEFHLASLLKLASHSFALQSVNQNFHPH
jgi:hypothetical protein